MTRQEKKSSGAAFKGKRHINVTVNGQLYELAVGTGAGKVNPSDTLSFTLRETLGLTATKVSCDSGACGGCTVLMDGRAVLSCMLLKDEDYSESSVIHHPSMYDMFKCGFILSVI